MDRQEHIHIITAGERIHAECRRARQRGLGNALHPLLAHHDIPAGLPVRPRYVREDPPRIPRGPVHVRSLRRIETALHGPVCGLLLAFRGGVLLV